MPLFLHMSKVTVLTSDTFESFSHQPFAIVDFWAPWCGPCRALLPILDKVAETHNVSIGKVSVEDETMKSWVEFYKIRSIPTLLFFKEGKLMETHVGSIPEKDLLDKIQSYNG